MILLVIFTLQAKLCFNFLILSVIPFCYSLFWTLSTWLGTATATFYILLVTVKSPFAPFNATHSTPHLITWLLNISHLFLFLSPLFSLAATSPLFLQLWARCPNHLHVKHLQSSCLPLHISKYSFPSIAGQGFDVVVDGVDMCFAVTLVFVEKKWK